MSVSFRGYNPNYRSNTNNTTNTTPQGQSKKSSSSAMVTATVVASTGLLAGILCKGKGGQKAVESISKKLPELETKAKSLWGKLTGSTKKAEEARKAEEQAELARKRAEEYARHLEEMDRAEKKAIEERKKALEEARKQREIKKAEEAAKKAEAEKARLAAQKAKEENYRFKNSSEEKINSFIDPEAEVPGVIDYPEWESWESYSERLHKVQAEKRAQIDYHAYTKRLENTSPETVFNSVAEQMENCYQNGGTATVDDAVKILESSRTKMELACFNVAKHDRFLSYDVKHVFGEYNKYLDEVLAEIEVNRASGENPAVIVRKSMTNVVNRREAAINARKAVVEAISKDYQAQLAPIKSRIRYDEANVPPVDKEVRLSPEKKQELADELNKIIGCGGSNPNFTAESNLYSMHAAWKNKYISIPFSMKCKEGETAVLDMFPRYESGVLKLNNGQTMNFGGQGEFKYEPLYRQMHVENPEEFVKQFENIGGEYAPGRLQSCSKEKYYGEAWGSLNDTRYGFTEWESDNNVKFVIHPKGPVSNAADIGEGKYGCCEAIYAADSKFRILGTLKKTVTPEEIQKGLGEFKSQFEDFQKYEIHLQEM